MQISTKRLPPIGRKRWQEALTYLGLGLIGSAIGIGAFVYWDNPEREADANTAAVSIRFFGEFRDLGEINADQAVVTLQKVCHNPAIKDVILHLSSDGGTGTESERIATTLDRDCAKKRVIALIEARCLSACYQVAAHADVIYANKYALVGAIGMIITWVDYSQALAREGVTERIISSGPAKAGPFGQTLLPAAAQANLQAAMTDAGLAYAQEVRTQRQGKVPAAAPIETGGMFSALRAKQYGLVDEIRTIDDLRAAYAGQLTELPATATGRPRHKAEQTRGEIMLDRARRSVENALR